MGRTAMDTIRVLFIVGLLTTIVDGNRGFARAQTGQDIRLVLQVTVDGLRADLLNRYEDGFGEGGFRFLMER